MGADYREYPFAQGEHPFGWVETTVRDVVLGIRSGYSSGEHNQVGQGLPHLRPMNVSPEGEITMDDVRYVSPDVGGLRLAEDDVLFTNTSSTAWVGKTALVKNSGDWGFSNHMTRLRIPEAMSPEFVARQLHYLCLCGYFEFHCKKYVNQSSIAGNQLAEDVPFRLPPANEQKRIVGKLRELLGRARNLRQNLEALGTLAEKYRVAVLDAACSGRLVPTEAELARDERRDFEPAAVLLERILHERRAKWEANCVAKIRSAGEMPADDKWKDRYRESPLLSTLDLPELPSGWTYSSMAQVCAVQGGIQKEPKRFAKSNHYPFLRVANVRRGELDLTAIHQVELFRGELEKYKLEFGDLLIVEGNGSLSEIGRMAVWGDEIPNCVHQNHIIRARPCRGFLGEFGTAYWNSSEGVARVKNVARSTSGLYTLSVEKIASLPIPLPPVAEQKRIVKELNRRLSAIDQIQQQVSAALTQTSELRASLFHRALSGKLVKQNHSDEPASELLMRIRAEREMRLETLKRSKPHRKANMNKLSSDVVKEVIWKLPKDRFTFDELSAVIHADYDPLKDIVFELLDETNPSLKQVFDAATQKLHLQRIKR